MKIGTKSVLFGAHCFILHPWFVALAWWKLYGFPFNPLLWIAFFVHDLGYFGKPNMDGDEGELHPYWGACVMGIFGKKWFDFTLYHSRFLAKKNNAHFSKLCVADKLAIALTPSWLYLPMVNWTGEIHEYMKDAAINSNGQIPIQDSQLFWHKSVQEYVVKWVNEHKDLKADTWTNARNRVAAKNGVWQ
jgi:hypothetical protein